MGNLYCEKCDEFVNYEIITKDEVFNILDKEDIKIKSKIAVCKNCRNELFLEELEDKNQTKAFNIYRENNNLLFPDDFKMIREMYGLTQREMSKLLGWGEITYHRYEKGSLPDQAHNTQILLMKNPMNVKSILKQGNHGLDKESAKKLEKVVNDLITRDTNLTKEIGISIPEDIFDEMYLKASKLGVKIEDYARSLLLKLYYEDVVEDVIQKTRKDTVLEMMNEVSIFIEHREWGNVIDSDLMQQPILDNLPRILM